MKKFCSEIELSASLLAAGCASASLIVKPTHYLPENKEYKSLEFLVISGHLSDSSKRVGYFSFNGMRSSSSNLASKSIFTLES